MSSSLKNQNLQPIVYALCVIAGLWLGKFLYQDGSLFSSFSSIEKSKGKINDILKKIDAYYVDDVDLLKLQEAGIAAILEKLDPHSYYLSPEEMQFEMEQMQGNFVGIGVEFKIINDTIAVLYPIPDGPSAQKGVLAGDKIIAVNELPFVGDSISNEIAMKTLRGERGSKVKVSFLRGKQVLSLTITRGEIPIKSVELAEQLSEALAYVKISRFAMQTHEEFRTAVNQLGGENLKGLIIDVRGNPGGMMESVIGICEDLFPKNTLLVYTKGREENEEYKTSKNGYLANVPVVILIDENSASASEILAGAVQDNDRGTVIGRRSFGKGLVQRPFDLLDGSNLRLTIARYYTPAGRCIQKDYAHGKEEYQIDLENRMLSGEFLSKDSIKVSDSLIFKTKAGKTVYGGGGIVPDIFIPLDTTRFFAFDSPHLELADVYFIQYFAYWKQQLKALPLSEAAHFLEKNLLRHSEKYFKQLPNEQSGNQLSLFQNAVNWKVKNKILQNLYGEKGWYYHALKTDSAILKAKELFNNK